jgi:hypothetical protein
MGLSASSFEVERKDTPQLGKQYGGCVMLVLSRKTDQTVVVETPATWSRIARSPCSQLATGR